MTPHRSAALMLAAFMVPGCQSPWQPVPDPPALHARDGIAELTLTAASDADGRGTSDNVVPTRALE